MTAEMPVGLVLINKGEGLTSQAVVNRVKRIFGQPKAGHTGTLDPLATGVLPVLLGRAVKASEFMLTEDKHYGATLLLGEERDTEDVTGELIASTDESRSEDEVMAAIASFVGETEQIPPMYSALKVGGRKLCDLARRGITIAREPRRVKIYSIDARKINDKEYFLDVKCSKGTYIRTLCADIGRRLGVGGVMKTLVRLSVSGFSIDSAYTLEELEGMTEEERLGTVIPTEEIFSHLPKVKLPPFFARLARSGQHIYLHKIGVSLDEGALVRLSDNGGFFGIGEVREYDDGTAIKPIRQF